MLEIFIFLTNLMHNKVKSQFRLRSWPINALYGVDNVINLPTVFQQQKYSLQVSYFVTQRPVIASSFVD